MGTAGSKELLMTKLTHYDGTCHARFVTFSCYRRLPFLNDIRAREILIEEIDRSRSKHGFKLFGYVLMPEHVHLVLSPAENMKLGLVIREIKSLSAKRYFSLTSGAPRGNKRVFWQSRCYDHNCRSQQRTIEKIEYCHRNPVVSGLVKDMKEWAWSSYAGYHGLGNVRLRIDSIAPGTASK